MSQVGIALVAQVPYALDLAEQLNEPVTAFFIERALDEARSKSFSGLPLEESVRIN